MNQKDFDREARLAGNKVLMARLGSCWILTDGKVGDEGQCVGVAEALEVPYELRHVRPKPPFSWLMPYGPIDPRERPSAQNSPIAPPFPDLAIGSGRRAIAYLRHLKNASGGKTFTVCLKDPRTGSKAADLIWVPDHDALRGPNVLRSPTAPHRFSPMLLKQLRETPHPELDALRTPRIAVLVGGDSRHHTFSQDDCERLAAGLEALARDHSVSLMITTSRRTPTVLAERLVRFAAAEAHFFWKGTGDNPLGAILAKADGIVATADSTNMIGEAASTGKPIHVFHPTGGHKKIEHFLASLSTLDAIHPFPGPLKTTTYEPQDATLMIADAIRKAMAADRAGTLAT
ncbi:mitochondrial fission ELM1 family protein [Labrenzia sp. CE80]|uniref:mitochondrial fission ELM1 family protein n=1 Tax=Labrenzia sp. CE80 TaxID=1788986 RepID=UPI001AD92FFF|nr:mitochondrial fission ELM1 family protein [Labrenzia sp. CE80]